MLIFVTLYVPIDFIEKTEKVLYTYYEEVYRTECYIVASATDKRKDSLKEYMKKIKDMGIDIVTVREQNKQNKENEDE